MDRMRKLRRIGMAAITLAVAVTAGGCESALSARADRDVYRLERKRQSQVLGVVSETAISIGESPVHVPASAYAKVPPTDNRLPQGEGSAATQEATTQGGTTAGSVTTLPSGISGELLTTSELDDKEELPPLPQFPTAAPAGKKTSTFTLDDCFNYALGHSREYVTRKEDLYIATLSVTLQRHLFEPRFSATTEVGVVGNGEYNDYAAALRAAQTVGVKQKLPYGGEITATALAESVSKLREGAETSESAAIVLEANIPLLRGAGMTAQEELIQTERDLVYEVRTFERFRRGFLVTVASQYFDLVNQKAQIVNRVRNAESYIFIYQRTLALFKAGRQRISLLDVQRAKQSALESQSDLINAINSYELEVDSFKLVLGMPTDERLSIEPQFLSIAPPTTDETEALKIASRLRLDLQTTRDKVDDAKRRTGVAANALLPDLTVTGRASIGTDPDQKTLRINSDRVDYDAGIKLDLPLDRVAERNAYRTAQINFDRAKRGVDLAMDEVTIEVRSAVRQLKQQQDLVALQRNNIALAQRRKAFAEIQFRDGKIDNRDYLDAETALLQAQNSFAQAVSQLQIATLQYLRDTDQLRVDASGKLIQPGEQKKGETKPAAK